MCALQIFIIIIIIINLNSLDNKGSWRILKDFYCSVTILRELLLLLLMGIRSLMDQFMQQP